ncbi:MAG: ABC transporter permease subunit [Acidimicrobiales bacterium]
MIGSLLAHFPLQTVVTGAVTGVTYGVMAAGIVLIYRSSKVINFAMAEMGGFGAAVLSRMVINWHVNYWVSFVACVLIGAAVGAAIELTVVRRLFSAPRVVLMIATIGVAELLLYFQGILPIPTMVTGYPTPIASSWQIGSVVIQGQEILVLVVVGVLYAALWLFLGHTKYGLAIGASAANPNAARLAGINVRLTSTLVWTVAGTLTTIATILSAPLVTTTSTDTFSLGPTLLIRALAAALIARMVSIPIALVSGVAIGVGEALIYFNWPNQQGLLDLVLLGVILLTLIPLARKGVLSGAQSGWSFAPRVRPLPGVLHDWWVARRLPQMAVGVAIVAAVLLPFVLGEPSQQFLFSQVFIYAIAALSVTMLTGWAGQLSLGQFALVGLGAMSTVALSASVPFLVAVGLAAIIAAVIAALIGGTSLRIPGLLLSITTFAFAVAASSWLLGQSLFTGGALTTSISRASIGPISLASERAYYYFALVCFIIFAVIVSRLRRSEFGRSLIAVRDNERAAAALGLSPARTKLVAFMLAGALAGVAGGLLAGLLGNFDTSTFDPSASTSLVGIAVIGGLTSVAGTIIGALWVVGLPALANNSQLAQLLAGSIGLLVLLLYFPSGLVQILYSARDAVFERVARHRAQGVEPPPKPALPGRAALQRPPLASEIETTLFAERVSVSYGTQQVLFDVSLTVGRGEVVGLIGANGAGKTTLMNAICGFVPSSGNVEVLQQDVSGLSPSRRARRGVGRTFQGAELFGDLTVRETVQVALQRREHAGITAIGLGLPRARRVERTSRSDADEILDYLGLGRFADKFVNELSTGTRRITELACIVATEARVLCLDEPTAGIAQRETEAFGPLILRLASALEASVLIIEHDMPMLMSVSDRVYCMEMGKIIASGLPGSVRSDPDVIASYLGTVPAAINRSGSASPTRSTSPDGPGIVSSERQGVKAR